MNDSSTSRHKHQLIAEAFLPPPITDTDYRYPLQIPIQIPPITDTDFLMFLPIPQADWSLRERTVHVFFVPTTVPGANREGFKTVSLVTEDWIHKKKKEKSPAVSVTAHSSNHSRLCFILADNPTSAQHLT